MQIRDLIAQLQAFDPTAQVLVTIVKGDDINFEHIAEVRRENLSRIGSCVVIEPFED